MWIYEKSKKKRAIEVKIKVKRAALYPTIIKKRNRAGVVISIYTKLNKESRPLLEEINPKLLRSYKDQLSNISR